MKNSYPFCSLGLNFFLGESDVLLFFILQKSPPQPQNVCAPLPLSCLKINQHKSFTAVEVSVLFNASSVQPLIIGNCQKSNLFMHSPLSFLVTDLHFDCLSRHYQRWGVQSQTLDPRLSMQLGGALISFSQTPRVTTKNQMKGNNQPVCPHYSQLTSYMLNGVLKEQMFIITQKDMGNCHQLSFNKFPLTSFIQI